LLILFGGQDLELLLLFADPHRRLLTNALLNPVRLSASSSLHWWSGAWPSRRGRLAGLGGKLLVDVAVSRRTQPCWASYIDPQQRATVKGL
jgi:hypothetical protein